MPIHFKYLNNWRKINKDYLYNYNNIFLEYITKIISKNSTLIWRKFNNLQKYEYNNSYYNVDETLSSMYYPKYHMFNKKNEQKYYKRCGTIIIININNIRHIIVVKGYGGKWSLPKGKPNENESEEDCAIRETYEETNIKLKSLKECKKIKFGKNIYFIFYMNYNDFFKENLVTNDINEVEMIDIINIEDIILLDCNKDLRGLSKIINKI
jgi:hypothetical protein